MSDQARAQAEAEYRDFVRRIKRMRDDGSLPPREASSELQPRAPLADGDKSRDDLTPIT